MNSYRPDNLLQRRIFVFSWAVLLLFLILFGRLWYLQITNAPRFLQLAERNRLRVIEMPAPRGLFLDRNGKVLVDNEVSFSLILRREFMRDEEKLLTTLEKNLGLDREALKQKLAEYRNVATVFPIAVKNYMVFKDIAYVEAHRDTYPELSLEWVPSRHYLGGEMGCHLTGYTGEITVEELKQKQFRNLVPGDMVGKSGLERYYNAKLVGIKGQRKVFINSRGQVVEELERVPARKGEDLHLTIDFDLQMAAEQLMAEQKGAVVALNPQTGEIYCLVSKPEYNPNLFVGRLPPGTWKEFIENPDKPLQNKVVQGLYAPGSIFKILVAAAALGENIISPATSHYCGGVTTMFNREVHCWQEKGHGHVSLLDAISNSCNIFFYNVGSELGVDRINLWSRRMGLGSRTGIDLPGESPGLIPSSEWKRRVYKQPWYQGETISVAIGQGAVTVTPIQVACFMAAVAMNAEPPVPHLLKEKTPDRPVFKGYPLMPPEVHAILVQGMKNVIEGGTGTKARLSGIEVAGKTGTAQLINTETAEKMKDYTEKFKENSWFACFAPAHAPRIAIAVIIEHGGHGGTSAAPVAQGIMEQYFQLYTPEGRRRITDDKPQLAQN